MRIRKITFTSHPIFGNLNLDFTDVNDNSVDTIILAGENGSGKSMLLKIIFELSEWNTLMSNPIQKGCKILFEVEESNNEKLKLLNQHAKMFNGGEIQGNVFQIIVDYSIPASGDRVKLRIPYNGNFNVSPIPSFPQLSDSHTILNTILLDTDISHTPNKITTITASTLDNELKKSLKSKRLASTELTQLLIDIEIADALQVYRYQRRNPDKYISLTDGFGRMQRFTNAFNFMFPYKKWIGVHSENNVNRVMFQENGNEMSIENLSSGEKQIVFRGGFLLRNKESTNGALILIEEPELNMHPQWQKKILDFFKTLFVDESGVQTSQIIVTTHSPFIIHNHNRINDKVVVLVKDEKGNISVPDKPKFYNCSSEELIQDAFKLEYKFDSDKIIVFCEGSTDETYFRKCQTIFNKENIPIVFKWIGYEGLNGTAEYTGDSALTKTYDAYKAKPDLIKNKIVFYYDLEHEIEEKDNGKLYIRKAKHNNENNTYTIGIENLLTEVIETPPQKFRKPKTVVDKVGCVTKTEKFDKVGLCNFICNELGIEKQRIVLAKLNEELDRIYNSVK